MHPYEPIRRLERIRGSNFETPCIIELRRNTTNLVDVVWAQTRPPENGDYELSVGAQEVRVRYLDGDWLTSSYEPSEARLRAHPQVVFNPVY